MIDIKLLEKQFKYLKIYGSDTAIHTPFKLVEEMLDKLPIDWSDPKLTFLDPCCGRGTFLICIYNRLFNSLKSIIINDQERKNHILNNMIYGVDVNNINIKIVKKYLPSKNIICADSLEYKLNMKFDVIVGNPPFQSPEDRTNNGRSSKAKGYKQPLWPLFYVKGLNLLKEGGVLSLISPSSWLSGSYDIRKGRIYLINIFKKFNLKYVDFTIKKYFDKIGSNFCYTIIENKSYENTTIFNTCGDRFNIDIKNIKMMPKNLVKTAININNKTIFSNCEKLIINSTNCKLKTIDRSNEKNDSCHYKAYVCGGDIGETYFAYWPYSDEYQFKKIIIPKSGADKFRPYVDTDGIGIGNNQTWYINFEDSWTKDNIVSVVNSKLYRFLIQNNRYSGFVSTIVAKNLPKVDFSKKWTDEELYKYFNLTQEEIDYIEANV